MTFQLNRHWWWFQFEWWRVLWWRACFGSELTVNHYWWQIDWIQAWLSLEKVTGNVNSGKIGVQLKIDTCILKVKTLKRIWDPLIHAHAVQKSVYECFMHCNICVMSIDFQDDVNDLNVSANEYIFFSFVWRMTHKNAKNCYWTLVKMQKSLFNLIYAQIIVFRR